DNTRPTLVSSDPVDGSVVASVSSVSAVASESIGSIAALSLDGAPAAIQAAINGASLTFPTGALAPGVHAITGRLVDLAGLSSPFRINLTVPSGDSMAGTS